MSNNADILQAQLDLNALIQTQQAQELVIDQAKTDLLNLIFLKADSPIAIRDTIIVDRTVNLDSVRNKINNHPVIVAASQQIHINELIERKRPPCVIQPFALLRVIILPVAKVLQGLLC